MSGFVTISGRTVSGLVIDPGAIVEIVSGATAIGTLVKDGGSEIVVSGGVTVSTTVRAGGYEIVSSGGTALDTGVKDGGYLNVGPGGSASSAAVSGGGTLIVSSGGTAFDTGSGGAAVVLVTSVVPSGQTVSGLVIGSGTTLDVASGGFVLSTTILSGGSETILSGGSAASTTVDAGGAMNVVSGGTVMNTVVSSGGSFTLLSGASMSGTTLTNGADAAITLVARSGVVSSGLVANSATSVFVLSGGTALDTTVLSGGTAIVNAQGTEISSTISAGGYDLISGMSYDPVISGTMEVTGGVVSGAVIAGGGRLDFGYAALGESVVSDATITGSGVLDLGATGAADGVIVFGGQGSLIVSAATPFATLSGFGLGNSLDLTFAKYTSDGSATFGDGSLIVTEDYENFVLQVAGNYAGDTFVVAPDNAAGTLVTLSALSCFAAGTLIATTGGAVAVERLAVGDRVLTADADPRPIVWIGQRSIDCRHHPEPARINPVRIRAHAFGPGRPGRTLFLSPDHAIFAEGVLIPVKHLIDGAAIAQVAVERVTYHHIELPDHAVILAEGLPVESYLDTGDRGAFPGAGQTTMLHPAFGSERADVAFLIEALACAPFRVAGPEVQRVRAALRRGPTAAPDTVRPDGARVA